MSSREGKVEVPFHSVFLFEVFIAFISLPRAYYYCLYVHLHYLFIYRSIYHIFKVKRYFALLLCLGKVKHLLINLKHSHSVMHCQPGHHYGIVHSVQGEAAAW